MKDLFYLNKYLYKYRYRIILGVIFIAIANIFALVTPQYIRHSFDTLEEIIIQYNAASIPIEKSAIQNNAAQQLLVYCFIIIGAAILRGVFTFFMRQTIIIMSRYVEYDLKNEIYSKYQALSMSFYKENRTGDLMARISEDVTKVRMYVGPAIMYTINLLILFCFVIGAMFSVNSTLTLYSLIPLPLLSISVYYISKKINVRSETVQKQLSVMSTFVQEVFSGIKVLKAYVKEDVFLKQYGLECDTYKRKSMSLVFTDALFHPSVLLLIGLSTLLTIYIGGKEAISGNISIGNIAEFIYYINMLTWPVATVGWVTSIVQRAAASQQRINDFLSLKPEIENKVFTQTDIRGDIIFQNVTFTYSNSGITALKNVSFHLKEGNTLGIIGKTGSGKTTIANLLLRLYDVKGGAVLIDNHNIKEINLDVLRNKIGYVPQDTFLFSETIYNNIAFGSKDTDNVSLQEIKNVSQEAVVYENIMEFPQQFETYVGERGITLSGGQKQRIAIARAILNTPKIFIFDDCLSAVDAETEEIILSNLKKRIMEGRNSTVIISHKVSTVKMANHIIVLDRGEIIEEGNHQDLLKNKGLYYKFNKEKLGISN